MTNKIKNVVVIGGARPGSMGQQFIREYYTKGAENVAIFDVCDPETAIAELKSEFPKKTVLFHKVDVRRRDEIERAFNSVVKAFGHVDVVANFAGIVNESRPIDTVEINLIGVINATLVAIDHMSISKGGHGGMIINVASIAGLEPFSWGPSYCASKYGVVGFTRSLAKQDLESELGIKFIIICPAFTDTKFLETDFDSVTFGQNGASVVRRAIDKYGIQTVDECVKNMVEVIKKSNNGDTWMINKGAHEKVNLN